MKKSAIKKMPEYFSTYINEVPDIELLEALRTFKIDLLKEKFDQLKALEDKVYAPGKWTIKDIIQHITDAERIFNYRALRFARNDSTILPGFDENIYAALANATKRNLEDLIDEFNTVRKSTAQMFDSFDDEMLNRVGKNSGKECSVLSIGFIIAGHSAHHIDVMMEKYLPLTKG